MEKVKNIMLIVSDNHNPAFSGTYGGVTRTPTLDALARSGVRRVRQIR